MLSRSVCLPCRQMWEVCGCIDRIKKHHRDGRICRRWLQKGPVKNLVHPFVTEKEVCRNRRKRGIFNQRYFQFDTLDLKVNTSASSLSLIQNGFPLSCSQSSSKNIFVEKTHPRHSQRRLYTPLSISQQTVDIAVPEETDPKEYMSKTGHNPPAALYKPSQGKRMVLRRPLGGIELMYNKNTSQGADIICLMTKIRTTYHVTHEAARKALTLLHLRHPLLRMRIKANGSPGHFDLVENLEQVCDFQVSDRADWTQYMLEELENPFDGENQPLVRYRLLNSRRFDDDQKMHSNMAARRQELFCYEATFLFIMHHAIMDGVYSLWIFQDLIRFLDGVLEKRDFGRVKELPLLPAMENFFTFKNKYKNNCQGTRNPKTLPDCKLRFCHNSEDDTVLKAYENTFQREIDTTPGQILKNNFILFKLGEEDTKSFQSAYEHHNCSAKSAIAAASVLALLDLVYNSAHALNDVTVPVEFMMDFRRFCESNDLGKDVPQYPGVAAFHIPSEVKLQLEGKVTRDKFWKIASSFEEYLSNEVLSPEVYKWIPEEADKYSKDPNCDEEDHGKSPYVLSISNMGKLENVLNSDISQRVRLVDLHGHSSILVDHMPLFFITTFLINSHFCGNVSFCENYTSLKTAVKYKGHVLKYLLMDSKL